jgi:hypothetical protein
LNIVALLIFALLLLVAGGWGWLEWNYRRQPGNHLAAEPGTWQLQVQKPQHYRLVGEMLLVNRTQHLEIMVPQAEAEATLLGQGSLAGVRWQTQITPCHEDMPAREDGYWFAYIVKVGKTTRVQVSLDITGDDLTHLQSAWIRFRYVTYGPQGYIRQTRHVVVPLQFPDPMLPLAWENLPSAEVLPVKTHLLSHLDTPVEIVKRYVAPHAQPGDIVTIGETPLAIMQGRWRSPTDVRPGWVAKRLCYFFLPTSSMATACGLQTLVDIVGPARVLFAFFGGALAKILGKPGGFYQLAGEQARLIDDVTGTLPPYDQFIVLGPVDPQKVVETIQRETGLLAAIVDVNDLKAVKIVAATPDTNPTVVTEALRSTPAGNADRQTPLVLIRPK